MIIADTGFWLALANKDDQYHVRATTILQNLNPHLITTWPVLTETSYLLLTRLGFSSQQKFWDVIIHGGCAVYDIKHDELPRMLQLMGKYRDLPMDLADASLVLLAEQMGRGDILSTDLRDFRTYRWKNRKPFKNLLEPL